MKARLNKGAIYVGITCPDCGWKSWEFRMRDAYSAKYIYRFLVFILAFHHLGAKHIAWDYAKEK